MKNLCILSILIAALSASNLMAFDLQGHRGARGLMPENTLPAFARALSIGVSTLEFDAAITKDNIVVISHNRGLDKALTRGPDNKWINKSILIRNLTFQQLQQYDVGRLDPDSRAASRFGKQKSVDQTTIPSLQQVFDLVRKSGNKKVKFNIETKIDPSKPDESLKPEKFVKALLKIIENNAMAARVSIQSFDWRTLQLVQKINTDINTVYLTAQQRWLNNVKSVDGNASIWTAGFNLNDHQGNVGKLIKAAGGKIWSPFFGDLTPALIKQAHLEGLLVVPWTVNDESAMETLIKLGVDGIISDYPDLLRKVMQSNGLKLPAATPVDP